MMPHTVPNNPTNGAVAPMVARMPVPRIICRPAAASRRSSREAMRSFTPAADMASADSRNSVSAAPISAAALLSCPFRRAMASAHERAWLERVDRRAHAAAGDHELDRLGEPDRPGQHRGEDQPIITALTTMSAAMNMPQGDRSRGSWHTSGAGGTGGVVARPAPRRREPQAPPAAFARRPKQAASGPWQHGRQKRPLPGIGKIAAHRTTDPFYPPPTVTLLTHWPPNQ